MAFRVHEGAEPIPGYQLERKLGTGGYGEVWQATAPGGLKKAIKIIYGHRDDARAEQEWRALNRIKEVRHPFLISLERYEVIEDQLFIVTEVAEGSLMDRFEECRAAGLPGIPRDELLGYLRDSADALDYMNDRFDLQHLDIKPQNLLLVAGRIKIADFGLVKDLRGTTATATGGVTPLYASPEAFDGKISRFSDQYSLAIVYQEMLTGTRPFPGKTALQLAAQHMSSPPLLDPLPPHDRPIIGRALAKKSDQRFPTCREMVEHLLRAQPPALAPLSPVAFLPPSGPALQEAETPLEEVENILDLDTLGSDELPPAAAPPAPAGRGERQRSGEADRPRTPPAAEEDVLNLDTLVGAEMPHRTPRPGPVARQRGLRPEGARLPRPPGEARLRPTLFLGLGGLAGRTLRRLRRRLYLRFGPLAAAPLFRFLLLDTDGVSVRLAHQGKPGEALDPGETLLLPLRKAEHYRPRSRELLRWLDRRYLYGIPRSLLTEGKRPLGRLAFVDNAGAVLARLRETLSVLASPEAVETTAKTTGLGLRDETPRVFLVASVCGGTGGAMLLDAAYAVRQVLADLGLSDEGLCGLLMYATGYDPTLRAQGQVNAFATLTELGHFSRPDAAFPGDPSHGLAPFQAGIPPLEDCYFLHLGEQLAENELDSATEGPAEYLSLDAFTPAGPFLDRYRRNHRPDPEADATLRTFGLQRISFPRYRLAELAARLLCRDLLSRWLGQPGSPPDDQQKAEVLRQAADRGLDLEAIAGRLQAAVQAAWGEEPEAFFQGLTARLQAQPPTPKPGAPAELSGQLFAQVDDSLGLPRAPRPGQKPASSSPEGALHQRLEEVKGEIGQALVTWLIARVEDPRGRLQAARDAASLLLQQVSALAESARGRLGECQATQAALRQGPATGESPARSGSGARWLGIGRRPAAPPAGPGARIPEYARLRLQEVILDASLEVFRSVAQRLSDFARELSLARDKLAHLAETLAPELSPAAPPSAPEPGVVELLPDQAGSLPEAAEAVHQRLGPQLVAPLDEKLQAEVLGPQGGLWAVLTRKREPVEMLREESQSRAQAAVLGALQDLDAARLFLLSRDEPGQVERDLAASIEAAAPRLPTPDEGRHLVVALPQGRAGATLRELLGQEFPNLPLTVLDSEGDVVFCTEAVGLRLAQLAGDLVEHEATAADFARKFLTRVDVTWARLPLAES